MYNINIAVYERINSWIITQKRGVPLYYCCGITDKGPYRDNNEDAYLINKYVPSLTSREEELYPPFIAAVADGVGGEASGEIASGMALRLLSSVSPSKSGAFHKKIISIHRRIRRYGMTHPKAANMQTTLCALAVDENGTASIINVGDSRLYRFRNGMIKQLSTDQSLVQMLYEQGKISFDEKKSHAQKNVIFPVLGNISEEPVPVITEIEGGIIKGDLIIICTDGLSDHITTGEFEEILSLPMRLPKRLKKLIDTAISNGSPDNVTVVGISLK